jgi:hypothetical protein
VGALEAPCALGDSAYRVKYGTSGVTSSGILSRTDSLVKGLAFIKLTPAFQGSIFTLEPNGSAAI